MRIRLQVGFVVDFKSHAALAQFVHSFFYAVYGKIQHRESGGRGGRRSKAERAKKRTTWCPAVSKWQLNFQMDKGHLEEKRAFKTRSRCCGISQTVRIGVSLRYIRRNVCCEVWLHLAFVKTQAIHQTQAQGRTQSRRVRTGSLSSRASFRETPPVKFTATHGAGSRSSSSGVRSWAPASHV
jgi:hypothetical protein